MKLALEILLAIATAISGCASDTRPAEPAKRAPEPPVVEQAPSEPGPIRFYCSTLPGESANTCVLAAEGGDDVFARRYAERCKQTGACVANDGAWCYGPLPASNEHDYPYKGDKALCFAAKTDCDERDDRVAAGMLCAPLSADKAIRELETTGFDRAEPPSVDYYCSDVASDNERCFKSLWACAYRRFQWLRASTPCRRLERVWCYRAASLRSMGVDKVFDQCLPSRQACKTERAREREATDCVEKDNPSI